MSNSFIHTFITKYKPYHVDDFFANHNKIKSVIDTLKDMNDMNMLFIGEPSSGKTTLLYAIIRGYYKLPEQGSIPETNILFINNLKEQGIGYYRNEMKLFCQSHCSIYGSKKMVIIDDIDNINEQSQQVFRNYIDKYKHNVHFIFSCTNIQKVIESIQSRCHIIHIPSATLDQCTAIMNRIIEAEKLIITDEAKHHLLLIANCSIRNLINNLEKIYILSKPVDLQLCKQVCSNISFQLFEQYFSHLQQKELAKAILVLYSIYDYGYSVIDILDYLFIFIKGTELLNEEHKYKMIPKLCTAITLFHSLHEDVIELSFLTNQIYNILHE